MEFHAGGDLLSLMQRMGNRLEETAVRFYTAEVRIPLFSCAEQCCGSRFIESGSGSRILFLSVFVSREVRF
jgi:hypothetical protein